MKKLMMMTVVVALAVASSWGENAAFARATGASMRLDTRAGVRLAAKGASETIAYSPRWGADGHAGRMTLPACTVTADGVTLKTASEDGEVEWSPDSTGAHTLTHAAGDLTYSAQFTVLGDDVAQHAGALAANETWGSNQVHLVTADVTVPSGKTLTIEPGTVVKFMTGTSLTVNGTCVAYGVIFTHVNDDSAGGDTLMDGDATKPVMDGYKLSGNIYEDDATEERYTAPQTLTSSISGTLRLKGHKVYLANSSITVNSGATLTLMPGAIIKFASGCSMTVNGTLDAQGTRAAPIVFTSQKDDEWGGDTNGDGEKTYAQAGDWTGLYVNGTANLAYCIAMYAAPSNERGNIECRSGGRLTMNGCTVAHSLYDGVWNWGGTIRITNSIFFDCGNAVCPYQGSTECDNCVMFECNYGYMDWSHWVGGTFKNCIFYGMGMNWSDTQGASEFQSHSTIKNCCFYNPEGYSKRNCTKDGVDGCLYADPKFVDPDNGDFRIGTDSPCIDAGDGTVAPELDYWGQPRMDAKGKNATGVPNADGICPDIGIYEFPGKVTVPVADLAVLSVMAPATAVPGEEIALTYVVTNRGGTNAVGMVRDRFQLKGADAALGGQTVAAGEVQQPYSLAAGAAATLTARVKCPTVKSGNWTLGVTVNAERDVFEQVTANNTGWASEVTAVELEALSAGESRVSVAAGAASGFVLGEGVRTLRVASDAALDKIAVYGANGAVPASAEGGVAAVRLGDGSWLLVLPEAAADEKGYVVVENGGTTAVELKVTAEAEKLAVLGVAPSRVAAVDGVSVTITGTGLAEGQAVTLGGRMATKVVKVNEAQIVATFNLAGLAAGASTIEVRSDGVPPSQSSVEVYKTTQGPKLEAKLVLPSSVRDGRIYTAWVEYANVGDEPMTMPVFKVERTDSSTKLGLATAALTDTKVFVGGIAPNHPAGVLQPGDSGRIPVFFMPSGSYGLKLTHTKETDNTEQFAAFGGVKPYLAAMSAAATRLNLRGKTAYNVHDFVDQAEAEKNGVPCAAVSGTVRNATTAEVLSGVAVALVSTNGLGVVETVTDENGYFQLSGLADGIYHFNLAGEYELDSASVGDIEITGQADRNDIGVLVRVGGCVKGTVSVNDGVPVEGARVFIEGDSGKIEEVTTDVSGGYAFTRIFDGAYKVGVCGTDGYAGEMKTNVVVDAVNRSVTIDFCLVRGGVVRGEVTGIGTDVTNGCVWAMTVSGDIISATCDERGGFEFPGLAANTYTFQYQSAQHVSDISTIGVLAGATCLVNLSARARPLFRTTQKIGFGYLETSFVFEDYNRSTNITSWAWDFDADGKVDSRDPSPTHTYTAVGTNTVVLTFVEDGVTYSTTNVACAIVEDPIETVYTDKAVVLGVNAGGLAAVELMADGVLVLTGTPDRTLTVGDVVVGAIGDDGFARRVLAVKGDSTRWELQTEDAPIEDVFVSVGMAGRSVQRRQVRRQMAASKTSANVLNAASSETSGGSGKKRFYTEGGGSFDFNYDFDISIDYALKRLNGKTYWRIVPVLTFERTIKSEFQIGAGVHQKVSESAETPPVLCITAGPIPVPVVTGHFEVEFYASWDVGGKFVGGSEDFVRDTFKYGYEYYEGQLNVVKEHHVDHDSPKSQWDVEGSANAEVGAVFGFKLRALAVMSASIGPKFAVGIKATESLHSPSKVSIYGKLGVEAEANLIDLDFNLSPFDYKRGVTWFWGITSDLVSYTGPTADFSMAPPSGQAPLHVDFSYTGAKEKTQFLWWEKEYTPWKLSWKGTNWDGDPDGKLTESEGDYNSEAKWPVKLSVRGHVMNVLWPKTKTKYVIVGDPEETPDDGDDVTDNTGGGTPAKSCDPNEMDGPLGAGDPETERFVKPGEWMDYTIYFENKADADVPAQEVFVDAQLNEWLDWSTFEMGEVAFNNQNETVLAGLKNGMKTVAQNGVDYKVQISVAFDEKSGAAHWYLRSYDPSQPDYNYWPAAVDAGFLPPNDETHRGEGHITYRVKVREDAPKGVKIDAAATIVFDQNDPIQTDPSWWNTVAQMQGVKVTVGDMETTLELIVGLPYGTLPDPGAAPEGYSFGGWFTGPNGTGRQIASDSLVKAGDAGLYQYWKKDEPPPVEPVVTNKITYVGLEGAANPNPVTFTTNDLPLALGPVDREGYKFLGWTPNGGVIPEGTVTNVTFAAQWEVLKYTVDIDGVVGTDFAYGQEVTAASPLENVAGDTNLVCVGWIGTGDVPATGVGTQVTFTVTQASSLRWVYETNYWFEVSVEGQGVVEVGAEGFAADPAGCWVPAGTNVSVAAVADEHGHFTGWADAVTGAAVSDEPELTFVMDGPVLLVAGFAVDTFKVAFDLGEFGMRTGGGELVQTVEYGKAAVEPELSVEEGHRFVGWDRPFDRVEEDLVVTAQYDEMRYAIAYQGTMGCDNSANPAEYSMADGRIEFHSLTNPPGWRFVGWDPAAIEAGTLGAVTVTAQWEHVAYTVDVPGAVGDHYYGDVVTAASPLESIAGDTNLVCVGWTGTGDVPATGVGTQVTFTVTQASSLRWIYETNYWFEASVDGQGAVAVGEGGFAADPAGCWVPAGTNVSVTAVADEHWHFVGWTDAETGAAVAETPELAFVMNGPVSLVAGFAVDTFTVTFDLGEFGTRTGGGELVQTVEYGKAAVVPELSVEAGHVFVGWDKTFDVVTGDIVVTALYDEIRFAITYTETMGCDNLANPAEYSVADGRIEFHSLTNPPGWRFVGWDPAAIEAGTLGAVTVTAQWEHIKYAVDVPGVEGERFYGDVVTAASLRENVAGDTNLVCVGWTGTGDVPATGVGTQVTFTVTQTSSLRWVYETNYWFEASVEGQGVVEVGEEGFAADPAGCWVPAGMNVSVAAVAAEHGHFTGWTDAVTGAAVSDEPELTFVMDGPVLLVAGFTVDTFKVAFDLGEFGTRTGGGELVQTVEYGKAAMAPTVGAVDGYTFTGWDESFDRVTEDLDVFAQYEETVFKVTYADTFGCDNSANPDDYTISDAVTFFGLSNRSGWRFVGWDPAGIDMGTTGDLTVKALWEEIPTVIRPEEVVDSPAVEKKALTYVAYLYDAKDGALAGTVQVTAGKGKRDKKTNAFTSKVSVSIQLAGETKKVSISGTYDLLSQEPQTFASKSKPVREVTLRLGANGVTGSFEGYVVGGVPKTAVAADYEGAYNVFADEGQFVVTVAKKGTAKVAGVTASGKSVSASMSLVMGERNACVPVVVTKHGLAFTLWLEGDGVSVEGLSNAVVGEAGALVGGAAFQVDAAQLAAKVGDATYSQYFPCGLAVEQNAKGKWIVADGAKAGSVALNRDGTVNEKKAGANPSALKLTHTAKKGTFTGSFKAYYVSKGKPKAVSFKVTGLLVNGIGYGTATATVNKQKVSLGILVE